MSSESLLRKSSTDIFVCATPRISNSRDSRFAFARLYSAGMSLRRVRSPAAPKITIMQGSAGRPELRCWGRESTSACAIHFSPELGSFLSDYRFDVSAKLLPHGGENLFRESVFLARPKTYEQCGRENIHRHGFVNRGFDCPSAFAGVLNEPAVFGKCGTVCQRHGREVQQPGADDTPAPPDFGDVGQVQIVLLIFGEFRLVRVAKNIEAFRIGLHDSVLDSVMHHFHKVAGARGAAIDVTFFSGTRQFFASRSTGNVAAAGGQSLKDGIELLNDFLWATEHHAIAAFQPPDTSAGSDVHVVNTFIAKHLGSANVVFEIRIAAVDQDVAGFHPLREGLNGRFGGTAGRNHKP